MAKPPKVHKVKRIAPNSIRRKFNKSQYPDMIAKGQLVQHIIRNNHLSNPRRVGEPFCTHSQIIRYHSQDGSWFVTVHQYKRLDGTIGASGKPDPKRLRIGNDVFISDTKA